MLPQQAAVDELGCERNVELVVPWWMKKKQYLAVLLAAACAASAGAQTYKWRAQQGPDLRSVLKQGKTPAQPPHPRQLSAEERAMLRQQLAQSVRHERKRP